MLLEIIEIQLVVETLEVNGFDFVPLWDSKEPQMNINKSVFAQMTANSGLYGARLSGDVEPPIALAKLILFS